MRQQLVDSINNGIGAFVSRLMIIAGFPAITILGAFAFNQWSENANLKLNAIKNDIQEIKDTGKNMQERVHLLENQTGRMDERLASQDARLTILEKRR